MDEWPSRHAGAASVDGAQAEHAPSSRADGEPTADDFPQQWCDALREQLLGRLRQALPKLLDRDRRSKQVLMDTYMAVHEMVSRRFGRECYEHVRETLAEHARQVVNSSENLDDLFRLSALYDGSLQDVQAACQYMERHYKVMDSPTFFGGTRELPEDDDATENPEGTRYEPVIDIGRRAFREAVVEYVKENETVRVGWLEAAVAELHAGATPTESTKQNRKLLSDAFQGSPGYYYEHFERPFIRAGVAYYNEKAKKFANDVDPSQYEEATHEWIQMETERAEVFLLEPRRSDYLTTLKELFDLGMEKFQRQA